MASDGQGDLIEKVSVERQIVAKGLRDSISDHRDYIRHLVEMDEKDKRVPTIPRTFPTVHPLEVVASFTTLPSGLEFVEGDGQMDEEKDFLERCALGLSFYEPKRIPFDISGTYFMYDENGNKIGVFKPFDEQVNKGLAAHDYTPMTIVAPMTIVVMCRHRVFSSKEKFGVLEEFAIGNLNI